MQKHNFFYFYGTVTKLVQLRLTNLHERFKMFVGNSGKNGQILDWTINEAKNTINPYC